MIVSRWSVEELEHFKSLSNEEKEVIWSTELPPDQETDPALWDSLIGFFRAAIEEALLVPENPLLVSRTNIGKLMRWAGREPRCLSSVLDQLIKERLLVPASEEFDVKDYAVSDKSVGDGLWRRNALDLAQRCRRMWKTSSPLKQRLSSAAAGHATLVAPKILEVQTSKIKTGQDQDHSYLATLMTLDEVTEQYCRGDGHEGLVMLAALAKLRKLPVVDLGADHGAYGVKLRGESIMREEDVAALRLKSSVQKVVAAERRLDSQIQADTEAAKNVLRDQRVSETARKKKAAQLLRVRRIREKRLDEIRASTVQLNKLLMAIEETRSTKQVLDAIQEGASNLRDISNRADLTVEKVEHIMTELGDAMYDQKQLSEALTSTVDIDADVLEELEAMEQDFLADQGASAPGPSSMPHAKEQSKKENLGQFSDAAEDPAQCQDVDDLAERLSNTSVSVRRKVLL